MSCRRRFSAGRRMIDWADLVASAVAGSPGNEAESGCPRPASGDTGTEAGTETDLQAIEKKAFADSCPRVPAVPVLFEHDWDRHANIAPRDRLRVSGGGEVTKNSAPEWIDAERGCRTCVHRRRPGLSDGYCGGDRTDLPPAYGVGHPLRVLPSDSGAECGQWLPGGGPYAKKMHKGSGEHVL